MKHLSRFQRTAILCVGICVLIANIAQPYPEVAPLQHLPTVLLLAAAPRLLARWPLSHGSIACIALFLLLHTLGGRYTYSNIPYDDWAQALWGASISETFGWTRNHYDRLVHLAFGALAVRPVREALTRHGGVRPGLAGWLAIECVLAVSALYEMLEWLLTLTAPASLADDYNGQQGDAWDAQKDMALALSGAVMTTLLMRLRRRIPRVAPPA